MMRHVGILTGGGDAPGLNAVIRAVVKYGVNQKGWQLTGIEDSFNGLMEQPFRVKNLNSATCKGILPRGGTMLGTTNRGDPFSFKGQDRSAVLAANIRALGIEGLIVLGGDGTMQIAQRLMDTHGVPVVGVPKTIDNDLGATDQTFGFSSAVQCVADALDRLHTTAESHDRVILLEVMGRDAGWIALHGGIAGGAHCIVIPEIPWTREKLCGKIKQRQDAGRNFSLIVVAEGARPAGEAIVPGKAAHRVADAILAEMPDTDVRITVLGHLQRGGSPIASDRILATRYGLGAVDLVEAGDWGRMVCLRDGRITSAPIRDAIASYHRVDATSELIRAARAVGVEFGG